MVADALAVGGCRLSPPSDPSRQPRRQVDRVAPFGQVLIGAAYYRLSNPGTSASVDGWDVALQPGGGFDIVLSDLVALRIGFDARVLFIEGEAETEFRFTTEVTFRSKTFALLRTHLREPGLPNA